jgi:hypothetical protein
MSEQPINPDFLPKSERTRKSKSVEQLDLVETIDTEKKSRRRRFVLILTLSLTIGLSIIFWTYAQINGLLSKHQFPRLSISLPHLSLPQPTNHGADLSSTILPVVSTDSGKWSVYTKNLTKSQVLLQLNTADFSESSIKSLTSQINKSTLDIPDDLRLALPPGVDIKYFQAGSNGDIEVGLLLGTPHDQLFYDIKIAQSSSIEKSKSLIPSVVSLIYWRVLQP